MSKAWMPHLKPDSGPKMAKKNATSSDTAATGSQGLYLVLISVHGLIRGENLELGRDADTGGQTKYVVEVARALAAQPGIARVDLMTRRVVDPNVDDDYALVEESLGGGARIVRLEAGPEEYIPKEQLWDYLDAFVDNALTYIHEQPRQPDIIHSHYADAGYVGSRLAGLLAVPLVHTGHSLGRVKRRRLLASGLTAEQVEARYNMARRIEAEEGTLASADLVITSTSQEIEEQYGLYDHYRPDVMQVIPPGVDLELFHPPQGGEADSEIAHEIRRFLREPDRPLILALSRPDRRKNIGTLLIAYGESPELQQLANLVVLAGQREDIGELEEGARDVLTDLLVLVDRYDLYGLVAYPKQHATDDVPTIYRLAAASGGVFVNPALTEPFGLTLIEAAASGLPLVATEDGGPRDIIANCANGELVDPLDSEAIAEALLKVLKDSDGWLTRAANGLRGVRRHYSWEAHAESYCETINSLLEGRRRPLRPVPARRPMLYHDRAIFTDLDQNLLADPESLAQFVSVMRDYRNCATFGVATGRRLDSALRVMRRHRIPEPDVLITSCGTEIHYAPELTADTAWERHIDHRWTPHVVRRVLDELPGLERQPRSQQSRFKISYYIDPQVAPSLDEINSLLHKEEQAVNVILSFGQFLDVLPIRASKGLALRYFANQWDIALEHILAAGGSGADEDMMRGNTLAVVVANRHNEELSKLVEVENIYFAKQAYAAGIIEAIDHFDFFGACRLPPREENVEAE